MIDVTMIVIAFAIVIVIIIIIIVMVKFTPDEREAGGCFSLLLGDLSPSAGSTGRRSGDIK